MGTRWYLINPGVIGGGRFAGEEGVRLTGVVSPSTGAMRPAWDAAWVGACVAELGPSLGRSLMLPCVLGESLQYCDEQKLVHAIARWHPLPSHSAAEARSGIRSFALPRGRRASPPIPQHCTDAATGEDAGEPFGTIGNRVPFGTRPELACEDDDQPVALFLRR